MGGVLIQKAHVVSPLGDNVRVKHLAHKTKRIAPLFFFHRRKSSLMGRFSLHLRRGGIFRPGCFSRRKAVQGPVLRQGLHARRSLLPPADSVRHKADILRRVLISPYIRRLCRTVRNGRFT